MIRILLADHVHLVGESISAILNAENDIEVIASDSSVEAVLERLAQIECDILLISSNFPNNGALTLAENVKATYPDLRMIVLGMFDNQAIIMRYIEAGAIGYVLRNEPLPMLIEKIRAAYDNRALIEPEIAAALFERVASLAEQLNELGIDPNEYDKLTKREKEVLVLIADGSSNQDIADQLVIEVGTVKNHVHNILEKLNVNTRQDAALYHSLIEHEQDTLSQ